MSTVYYAPSHAGMRYPGFVDPDPHRPGRPPKLPRVDEPIVRPETREEMVRGRLVHAAPALEPHADRHHALDFLTGGCVAPGYVGSSDLLTRTSVDSNFAADTSIRREGIDPETGGRYLEELAFEIVNEQSLRDITVRAEELSRRGVRRVIAILVKRDEVREWSAEKNDWVVLDLDGVLVDPALTMPVPVRALLERSAATRAVVGALRTNDDPAVAEIVAEGRREGLERGFREGLKALCEVLGIPLTRERRERIERLDVEALEALLDSVCEQRRWP